MQRKLAVWLTGSVGKRLARVSWLAAVVVSGALLAGCSSEPRGEGQGSSGEPVEPYATDEGPGPGATETNFITLPCDEDADCPEGRCLQPDAGPRRCD
jgi:hypothetical protein